jgi:hypothetical protein
MNTHANGQLTPETRPAADSSALTETLRRVRHQSPQESLGLASGNGLLKPSLQAAMGTAILLALLTVIPYFVSPPKASAENNGTPAPAEKAQPAETPKQPETQAKAPTNPKGAAEKGDILNKLKENETKTAPLKTNPLDNKDDDLLKGIK